MGVNMNPFSPSGLVGTSLFGGRYKYINTILSKLLQVRSGKHTSFYLYGERGIGKTALARFIDYLATDDNLDGYPMDFLTAYYSCQPNQTFTSVLEAVLNKLVDSLDNSVIDNLANRLGEIFKNGKFQIGAFGVSGSLDLGARRGENQSDTTVKDQSVSILRNLIREVRNTANEQGKKYDGILIIFDEMDNLADLDAAAAIVRGIATELDFDGKGYFSFMFIGYEQGMEKFTDGDRSIKRMLELIALEAMPVEEVKETFIKAFKAADLQWEEESLNSGSANTGGYPLAIQVSGYHLVSVDNDGLIDKSDWDKSKLSVLSDLTNREYVNYFNFRAKKKTNQDKILIALARTAFLGYGGVTRSQISA